MCLDVFLAPDTVNFYALSWREVNGPFAGTGYYSCQSGNCHCAACGTDCNTIGMTSTVVAGYGTQVNGVDKAYTGYCPASTDTSGTLTITIDTQWTTDTVVWSTIATPEQQNATLNTDGTMNITKGGASASCSITDASSASQCG